MIAFTEPLAGNGLSEIETLAKTFSAEHTRLADVCASLNTELARVRRRHEGRLRAAVTRAGEAKIDLQAAIAARPELFEKPRTVIFHGVKLGLQKGRGGIHFDEPERVVSLIRQHLGTEAEAYIRTVETPDKKMLDELPVSELKRLGCTLVCTDDQVVIKPAGSDIEKMVAMLLSTDVAAESSPAMS